MTRDWWLAQHLHLYSFRYTVDALMKQLFTFLFDHMPYPSRDQQHVINSTCWVPRPAGKLLLYGCILAEAWFLLMGHMLAAIIPMFLLGVGVNLTAGMMLALQLLAVH